MSNSSNKYLCLLNLTIFTPLYLSFLFLHLTILVAGDLPQTYFPLDNIALDCGSSSENFFNGRNWTADINSKVALLVEDSPPANSTAIGASTSSVPYNTARVSRSKFTYTFPVTTTGPKFVRLHFYPASYPGFDRSKACFSVTTGRYTFLSNFSGIHYSDPLGEQGYAREFSLNIEDEQKNLSITFTPSSHVADAYAFINGIEIVSMPSNLYYTAEDDRGLYDIDQKVYSPLQNGTALENMYRINVGGNNIAPFDDSGMFRSWSMNQGYLTDAGQSFDQYNGTIQLQYNNRTRSAAPDVLYRTATTILRDNNTVNEKYNLTWEFPVHSKFTYLVRLHFCQFIPLILQKSDLVFEIYIANQTAELYADVISWTGGNGVTVYKDYEVMMDARGSEEVQNLSIALHPSPKYSRYSNAMLNGIEIFKLSKSDNLAGPNPDGFHYSSNSNTPPIATSTKPKHSPRRTVIIIGGAVSGIAVVSVLIFLIFRKRVRKFKDLVSGDGASKLGPLVSSSTKTNRSSLPSDLCYRFSLAEIIAATNNFDDSFIIGVGGFGNVYKGLFDGGVISVAIKRLNPGSQQGETEFKTEIEMLSQLRFRHLVSLIGFCNENNEMILVYDYMSRGTLRDHLYRTDNPPLSWTQRLEICIGAAHGLHYLHTGAKRTVIHRDVKTTNILLDEKWVAKVSDFGLSKIGTTKGHVSTLVKGSIGYLDPEYCQRQQLTEKSDVYSFGVVLFEILCARPPINRSAVPASLAELARQSHRNGTINEIIDPYLDGKISPDCLNKFVDIAVRCLLENGIERPSMTDVVWGLEFALQLQETAEKYVQLVGAQTEKEVNLESPLKASSIDDSSGLFSSGSGLVVNSRILEMATCSSSDEQSLLSNESEKMMSGAVFSEIMNPEGR